MRAMKMKTQTFGERAVAKDGPAGSEATKPEPHEYEHPEEPDSHDPTTSQAAEPSSPVGTSAGENELPEEIRALLTEIGRAAQRVAMYPADHPAVDGSAAKLHELVGQALAGKEEIVIQVSPRQLTVGLAATNSSSPILSSLAGLLYRHQVLSLAIQLGTSAEEIATFLGVLTSEPEAGGIRFGAHPSSHILITAIPYEKLILDTEEHTRLPHGELSNAWLAFSKAALGDEALSVEEATDVDRLVEGISEIGSASGGKVMGRLLAVEQAIARSPDDGADVLSRLASEVVSKLDPKVLQQLLRHMGGSPERRQLLLAATEALDAQAMIKLLMEASRLEHSEAPEAVMMVLSKLANVAEQGGADEQSTTGLLREQALSLVTSWQTDLSSPDDYSEELAALSTANGQFVRREDRNSRTTIEPTRILQMAVETDRPGDAVYDAFNWLIQEGSLAALLDVLENADLKNSVAVQLRELLVNADEVPPLLVEEATDLNVIDQMTRVLGAQAAPALIEAMFESESRTRRRRVFQNLVGLGPGIGAKVVQRLDDDRWFVRRNLLELLDETGGGPDGFTALPFLDDEHESVRRTAIKLVLQEPGHRDRGIEAALASEDPRAVILGLVAAKSGCPPKSVDTIVSLALWKEESNDLRVHAVRALPGVRRESALKGLLRIGRGPRRWLPFRRSAAPTPLEHEALNVLRATWSDNPRAQRLVSRRGLEAEAESSDRQ